jgi:hypothetical protein
MAPIRARAISLWVSQGSSWLPRRDSAEVVATCSVRTYYVLMNITFTADERLIERAREVARRQGVSLNQLIRQYLESLAGDVPGEEVAAMLLALMEEQGGHSGGQPISRDTAYEGRV